MTEDAAPQREPGRGPRVALIALIVVVAVVVVAALVAVRLRGGPATFDPDSPEGVVQRYTQSLIDGDVTAAHELLAPTASDEGCGYFPGGLDDYRVTLVGTTTDGDSAQVRVLVTTIYRQGVFGGGEYQSEEVFRLVKPGGSWLIAAAPWQFTVCPEIVP